MKQILLVICLLFGLSANAELYIDTNKTITEDSFKRVITTTTPDYGIKVITENGVIFIKGSEKDSITRIDSIYDQLQNYYGWSDQYTQIMKRNADKANFNQWEF